MHVRKGTFKMKELIGIKKLVGASSLCLLWIKSLYWSRESKVADRAKPMQLKIKIILRGEDEPKTPK